MIGEFGGAPLPTELLEPDRNLFNQWPLVDIRDEVREIGDATFSELMLLFGCKMSDYLIANKANLESWMFGRIEPRLKDALIIHLKSATYQEDISRKNRAAAVKVIDMLVLNPQIAAYLAERKSSYTNKGVLKKSAAYTSQPTFTEWMRVNGGLSRIETLRLFDQTIGIE